MVIFHTNVIKDITTKLQRKYMHSVNSAFVQFLKHHEMQKPENLYELAKNKIVRYDYTLESPTATEKHHIKNISS